MNPGATAAVLICRDLHLKESCTKRTEAGVFWIVYGTAQLR